MKLVFFNQTRQKIDLGYLKKIEKLDFPYNNIREKKANIEVTFVGKDRIREVNRDFRKKDKVTDVISIGYGEEGLREGLLGEVLVFPKYKNFSKEEIGELLIHGVLHILGFDHEREKDASLMESVEKRLKKEIVV